MKKKQLIALNGSATRESSNAVILQYVKSILADEIEMEIMDDLSILPHFDTSISIDNCPLVVQDFLSKIESADGIIISSPEYIFSIPSRLKNVFEWCVATTAWTGVPTMTITASASGVKGQAELLLILDTLGASLSEDTNLLISGVKGKVSSTGIIDQKTTERIDELVASFLNIACTKT